MKTHITRIVIFLLCFGFALFATMTLSMAAFLLADPAGTLGNAVPEVNDTFGPQMPEPEVPTPDILGLDGSSTEVDSEFPADEIFVDSSHIGRRGRDKVVVRCGRRKDGPFAEIKFYTRAGRHRWKEKESFEFEKDGVLDCDPHLTDFNNDGYKDLTYVSNVAARVFSNEIRTLFIYDRKDDRLIHISNSEEYPNLAYNKKLKCLDSLMIYGATSTVFLKLNGNKLDEIATVSTGEDLTVTVKTNHGDKEVFRRKMDPDDVYTRYRSFNPPKP